MKDEWKHLYGVIEASQSLNISSSEANNGSGQIYAITYKDLSVIVSDCPPVDLKTLRRDLLVRHLLNHQKAVERIMNSCAIIPFKFGSFARTEKEVEQILILGYASSGLFSHGQWKGPNSNWWPRGTKNGYSKPFSRKSRTFNPFKK